jgi:hypothetical protein
VLLFIVGLILAIALVLAPLKLYEIARELKTLNETLRVHTRLLAAIANATNPVEETTPEK